MTAVWLPETGCALWPLTYFQRNRLFLLGLKHWIFLDVKTKAWKSQGMSELSWISLADFYFIMCQHFGAPEQNKNRLEFQAPLSLVDPSQIRAWCPQILTVQFQNTATSSNESFPHENEQEYRAANTEHCV